MAAEFKAKILFDVFVSEPIPVNKIIYRSWLDGLSEKEAALMKELTTSTLNQTVSLNNSYLLNYSTSLPASTMNSLGGTGTNTPVPPSVGIGLSGGMASGSREGLQPAILPSSTSSYHGSMNASTLMLNREMLLSETEDQFRNFELLQKALEHPKTLGSNSMFQMDIINRRLLIEGYYEFDDAFVRELIGRKFTSGQRRDLDDTAEKIKIRLSSCERQFDNLKRISRLVFADIKSSALDIIMNEFSLPRELSKKYVKILFLCFHRIDVSKKRIQALKTPALTKLSETIMNFWGDPVRAYTMELDIKLKEDVRDLKTHLMSQKDISEKYWKLIKGRYQSMPSSPKTGGSYSNLSLPSISGGAMSTPATTNSTPLTTSGTNIATTAASNSATNSLTNTNTTNTPMSSNYNSTNITPGSSSILLTTSLSVIKLATLESKFKSILKGILSIGSSLSDSKEFRNLFDDIAEKIIDPLKRMEINSNEADTFFILLREVFVPESIGLTSLRHKDRIVHNWKSFLEGIRGVVVPIYNDL